MASSSSSPPPVSSESNEDGRGSLLTFGIELEFVVAYLDKGKPDPHPEDKRNVYIAEKPPGYEQTFHLLEIYDMFRSWERPPGDKTRGGTPPTMTRGQFAEKYIPTQRYGGNPVEPAEFSWIRYRMARFLRDHNIRAISDSLDADTQSLRNNNAKDTMSRLGREGENPDPGVRYGTWDVNTDDSVGEDSTREYKWAQIEITSPILYFTPESLELVRYVVNLLQSEFRILINATMMYHVHVGRGAQGFSLTELRAISALLYAASPRRDQLHPIWCGPLTSWAPGARPHSLMANLDEKGMKKAAQQRKAAGPMNPLLTTETDMDLNTWPASMVALPYNRPIMTARAHELLQGWLGHQRANAFGIARIWQTKTMEELYQCMSTVFPETPKKHSYFYRPAYNFRNLVAKPVVKKTVEFRQHCGTMFPTTDN
ncbi:hypothetical protein PG987_008676 [Apiospora arundinis]